MERLGERLQALPKTVMEHRSVPLGVYRGLKFSLCLYAYHTPEICVEGAANRLGSLARDAGPLAVLNAVERIVAGYEAERDKTARDLDIAQNQLHDYETHLGGMFAHTAYLEELTGLRDSLEAALSSTTQAYDTDALVSRIKALKAAHTIEATPERSTQRRAASIEEAVTTRIMNRAREGEPMPEHPEAQLEQIVMPAAPVVPQKTAEVVVFKTPVQRSSKPKSTYQQSVAQDTRQMSLL